MEKGQKKATYNFYGAIGTSVDIYVKPKKKKNVRVNKIKVEACGKPGEGTCHYQNTPMQYRFLKCKS